MRGLSTRVRDHEYPGQFPPGREMPPEAPLLAAPTKTSGTALLLLAALGLVIIPAVKKHK